LSYLDDIVGIFSIAEGSQEVQITATFVFVLHIVLVSFDTFFPIVELVIRTVFSSEPE
jgi:hypothetical protein